MSWPTKIISTGPALPSKQVTLICGSWDDGYPCRLVPLVWWARLEITELSKVA